MNGKIYVIKNDVNDKLYVGQTTRTVEARFKQHLSSKPDPRHNQAILWAIQSLGREHFSVETLAEGITSYEEMNALEERYIAELNAMKPNGYNLCPGGQKWRNTTLANVEVDQRLVDAYLSGLSTRAVAEKFGCSVSKVKYHVKKAGHSLRKNNNPCSAHASELTEERLRALFLEEGKTDKQIAALTGMSPRWVRKRRQQFHIHRI